MRGRESWGKRRRLARWTTAGKFTTISGPTVGTSPARRARPTHRRGIDRVTQQMWMYVWFFAGLVGAIAVWIGWIGRREGDHPVCARCEFDLFGSPPGATVCSECGADLTNRAVAVCTGHRRRRTKMILGGTAALLISICGISRITTQWWPRFDVNSWKPYSLLRYELARPDAESRDVAARELAWRMQSKRLGPDDVQEVVSSILAWQADPAQTWSAPWGNLLEDAHDRGHVTAEQWSHYLAMAWEPGLRIRPILRRGDALPYEVTDERGRVGRRTRPCMWAEGEITRCTIGNSPIRFTAGKHSFGGLDLREADAWPGTLRFNQDDLSAVTEASTTLHADITVRFYDRAQPPRKALAKRTFTHMLHLDLASAQTEVVRLNTDPEMNAAAARSIAVLPPLNQPQVGPALVRLADGTATFQVEVRRPPIDLAYDVLLRSRDRSWSVGTLTNVTGEPRYTHTFTVNRCPAEPLEVVLRPSIPTALTTITHTTQIAGSEIVKPIGRASPPRDHD
jgi:hypothetical protein